jgi:protein Mpv17
MWTAISHLMRTSPYTFNIASSTAIAFAGDLGAQHIEHRQKDIMKEQPPPAADTDFQLNVVRSAAIVGWSALVMAPFYTKYFRWTDYQWPHRTLVHIGAKVALTASVCAPIMNGLYLAVTSGIENHYHPQPRSPMEMVSQIRKKIAAELPDLVLTSAKLWVPVNSLNWYFLPTHARVLLSTIVSVGWNAYISLVQHRPLPSEF